MIDLLESVLGTPVVLEELKHKPGRRTTSRAVGPRGSAIVKVYASERAPRVAARLGALAEGPAEPVVPEVLLIDAEAHLVVLSEVPGVPLREALLRDDFRTSARAGSVLGAWHRAWQDASPDALAAHTAERELEILRARIANASPEVAAAVVAVLPKVTEGDWECSTVVHRDLYEEQVMVDDRIGLIDLDDAALGPPELDVGNLLGHLDLLDLRSTRGLASVTDELLAAYNRSGPKLDTALLARCRSLTLLRLVCIHHEPRLLERLPELGARRRPAKPGDNSVAEGLRPFERLPGWLLSLSDRSAVGAALVRHVPEFASGELELRKCKVERIRLQHGSQTALYRLTYADRAAGHERVVEVLGEIVSPGAAEPSSGTNGAPFVTDGWRCYLSELRLDLGLPPPELRLPALSTLTDAEHARGFLERAIRAGSPAYANLRIQAARPLKIRPKGTRCTVVYALEYSPEDADSPSSVIAKTYRGDQGASTYAGMQALWSSKLGTSDAVTVAEPLAYEPELKVLLQGPVRGESTLTDLTRSAFASGSPEALGDVFAYVDKTALGLAALHTSGVTYGETITWAERVADVEEQLSWVAALAPELTGAAAPLLTRLAEREAEHPPDPLVPTHGSFRPNQVLLNAGEIGFIDFDRFCQAEPALDVASFLVGLKKAGRLDADDGAAERSDVRRARLSELDELGERFLQQYGAIANVSRERVVLWEALDLFNGVLDSWTKMRRGLEARVEHLRHYLRSSGLAT